ncbi:MAG TPA: DegT/DnrJ/EryC1/StrS family aminotransferase, partial [Clostridia bacterium]|nr:DegT/DnrJ/EryC1/StrS family aminotransferase [Clostridia bacterium]
MAVKFFDTTRQYYSLKKAMDSAAVSVLAGGQYILGENVAAFENACADYLGVKHAVGVANGSDALVIALDILGIGPGDEVITSP